MAKEITNIQLYVAAGEYDSYVAHCVALEKDLNIEIIEKLSSSDSSIKKTPTLKLPELIIDDRELITEYLEERFPYPPLYPFVPLLKAKCRDWCVKVAALVESISNKNLKYINESDLLKINAYLVDLEVELEDQEYLMGEDFNMVDLMVGSMIFLASPSNIKIKNSHKVLISYFKKLLKRSSLRSLYGHKLYFTNT